MRTKALALVVALLTAVLLAPAASAVPVDRRPTHVLGLRFATHPDFDRVVIDLRGSKPFFRTGRAARFSYEGSGKRVPIRGAAGVYISLTGSGHGPRGNNLYTGPRVARPRVRRPQGAGDHRRCRGAGDLCLRPAPPGRLHRALPPVAEPAGHRLPAPVSRLPSPPVSTAA